MDTTTKNQGTITKFAQETYLLIWIDAFLVYRKAQGLSEGTLSFYQKKLRLFTDYCDSQIITQITQMTPNQLRLYLLCLEEKGHNPGGIHAAYRAIRAFLNWWEIECEPENWNNPISKVKPPRFPVNPIEGVSIYDFHKLVDVCERRTYFRERSCDLLYKPRYWYKSIGTD